MKVKQTVEVRYSSAYTGWSGLEITDTDGTEVTIKMTKDEWLDLESKIISKCDGIRKDRQEQVNDLVEQQVAARLEKEQVDA